MLEREHLIDDCVHNLHYTLISHAPCEHEVNNLEPWKGTHHAEDVGLEVQPGGRNVVLRGSLETVVCEHDTLNVESRYWVERLGHRSEMVVIIGKECVTAVEHHTSLEVESPADSANSELIARVRRPTP